MAGQGPGAGDEHYEDLGARDREPIVEVLSEEWAAIAALCGAMSDEEWELPTDCPGWSVRDVLSHLVGTERSLLGESPPPLPDPMPPYVRNPVGATNEAWVASRRSLPGRRVLAEFEEVTSRRLRDLRSWSSPRFEEIVPSPVGKVPYREFMSVRVMDCWVHEQDVRMATGRPGHRDAPAAQIAFDRLSSATGFIVAKQAGAGEGSSVRFDVTGERPMRIDIVVREGRGRRTEDLSEPPTAVLRMDAETFWRLTCGRIEGSAAFSAGLVQVEGDSALGARVADSMPFMI
jgi:uncharacterized protein (TIGR03083 family)